MSDVKNGDLKHFRRYARVKATKHRKRQQAFKGWPKNRAAQAVVAKAEGRQ